LSATVDFVTVTNSIAAMSITGVSIKDIDEIPDAIGLDDHVLVPMPENFITNVLLERDELTGQKLRLSYTLTYRYYHCRIQATNLLGNYSSMVTYAAAIYLAFSSDVSLAGAVDDMSPTIGQMGPVSDPSGNAYHGFDITINCMQFLEV
jgi:hypothetical protein